MSIPESAGQGLERPGINPVALKLALSNLSILDREKMEVRSEFLPEGPGNPEDKHYYTTEGIQSCPEAFEGAQCYTNHPTPTEEEEQPERDFHKLIGYWHDVKAIKDDTVAEGVLSIANTSAGRDAFAQIEHAIEYQQRYPVAEKPYCGPSILAGGEAYLGDYNGEQWSFVTKINRGGSIDLVTKTGTKARFNEIMESLREAAKNNNEKEMKRMKKKALKSLVDECDAAMKKAKEGQTADLEAAFGKMRKMHDEMPEDAEEKDKKEPKTKESEPAPPPSVTKESWKGPEPAVLDAKLKESDKKLTETQTTLTEAQKENAVLKRENELLKSEKQATALLKESGLPAASCDRLFRQMLGQPEADMKSIIAEEKAFRESLIAEAQGKFRESNPVGPGRTGDPSDGGDFVLQTCRDD